MNRLSAARRKYEQAIELIAGALAQKPAAPFNDLLVIEQTINLISLKKVFYSEIFFFHIYTNILIYF